MAFEISRLIDRTFHATIGKLPYFQRYSPDVAVIGNSDQVVARHVDQHVEALALQDRSCPRLLDIGARDGARSGLARNCAYTGIDIAPKDSDIVAADICHCPELEDGAFDIVMSFDVFEHVERPWDAARECLRITRPGGLLICRTLFAYRYHPSPHDYWRFSSQGLEHLFTHTGKAHTLMAGYDLRGRRRNRTGSSLASRPPIDWLGGFRENWQVLWIGRRSSDEPTGEH